MIAIKIIEHALDALRRPRRPRSGPRAAASRAAARARRGNPQPAPPPARRPNRSTINDVEELGGRRGQVLASLRELGAGAEALALRQRDSWGVSARAGAARLDDWEANHPSELEVRILPGAFAARSTGRLLLEQGWIEPSPMELSTPLARFYVISPAGRRALSRAEGWWASLEPWQRWTIWILE